MLVTIYYMLRDGTDYVELGVDYYRRPNAEKIAKRSLRALEALGYIIQITHPEPSVI
jgi:hypothetical protein